MNQATLESLSTEELRAMASKSDNGQANWPDWTREMLMAFFHNRRHIYLRPESEAAFHD